MAEDLSVLKRESGPADFVVEYGPRSWQVADIRLPAQSRWPAPLVLVWHGGFWRSGHFRFEVALLADALARDGYAVASVEYGAGSSWTSTLSDVADAADAVPGLIDSAAPGSLDLSRIVYAGHSAGGHLAAWAALRDRLPDGAPGRSTSAPAVAGVLALAPALDLSHLARLGSGSDAVIEFLGGSPGTVPDRFAAADPSIIGLGDIRVAIVHGSADSLLPVSASREIAATTTARLFEVPEADHFAVIDPESVAWGTVLEALDWASVAPG